MPIQLDGLRWRFPVPEADIATLRREMIGWKTCARQTNVYRRLPEGQWETA